MEGADWRVVGDLLGKEARAELWVGVLKGLAKQRVERLLNSALCVGKDDDKGGEDVKALQATVLHFVGFDEQVLILEPGGNALQEGERLAELHRKGNPGEVFSNELFKGFPELNLTALWDENGERLAGKGALLCNGVALEDL